MFLVTKKDNFTLKEMWFRVDNIKSWILMYTWLTIFSVVFAYIMKELLNHWINPDWKTSMHFKITFLITAIIQNLVFKSFLLPLHMRVCKSVFWLVLFNAWLFWLMHIAIPPSLEHILISFFLWTLFTYVYIKNPNIYLIIIVHAIVNFVFHLFCFFDIACYYSTNL